MIIGATYRTAAADLIFSMVASAHDRRRWNAFTSGEDNVVKLSCLLEKWYQVVFKGSLVTQVTSIACNTIGSAWFDSERDSTALSTRACFEEEMKTQPSCSRTASAMAYPIPGLD